ncbi:MAG: ABC transporter permease [Methylacidiphilales bacterium]|nr:ABC transporter permease [Candidatus Methylacidiphilales bacterium]
MKTAHLFYRVVRRDPFLVACGLFLILVVLVSFVGIHFTGYTYDQISDDSLLRPSRAHWFGTDVNGHDLLTRTLYGAQISLFVAATGTLVSLTVGVTYGMISGYAGGRVDNLMMRIVEIIYSLPTLVLVIVIVTSLDDPMTTFLKSTGEWCTGLGLPGLAGFFTGINPRLLLIVGFLGLTEWLTMARIIRGQVLVLKEQPFVQASFALGQSHFQILWRHLLPNLLGIVIVYLTLTIPAIMLDESFMSFLGVGLQPPLASWGTLISDAAFLINPIRLYWWMLIFPGGLMTLTLLALNFLGDGLRDALDPRVKK